MDKTLTEQEIALLRRKLDLLLRTGQLLVESAADPHRRKLYHAGGECERRPAFVLQIPEMRKAWHQHDCHFRNQQTVLAGY